MIRTLRQALDAAAPALRPTARFNDPLVRISRDELRAFNGSLTTIVQLLAVSETSGIEQEIVVSGERLSKIWADGARLSVTDQFMTVTRGRSRYRLPILEATEFGAPTEFPTIQGRIHPWQVAAIGLAAHFASENATHPWACGVVLHNGLAIATNNKIVVSVYTELSLEGTVPFWALAPLSRAGVTHLHVDDHFIGIASDDLQVITFAAALSEKPPIEVIVKTIASMSTASSRLHVAAQPLREALDSILALGGNRVEFSGNTMSVRQDNGSEATHETEGVDFPPTTIGADLARLMLDDAHWVSFDQAPDRILFGRDTDESGVLLGVAMGMRV